MHQKGDDFDHKHKHTLENSAAVPGLYESVINQKLKTQLSLLPPDDLFTESLDPEESPQVLSEYLREPILKLLQAIKEQSDEEDILPNERAAANRILAVLTEIQSDYDTSDVGIPVDENPQLLRTVLPPREQRTQLHQSAKEVPRPQTSLVRSSLFTGAKHDPSLSSELIKEIASADVIELLVSFVKWSGIRPLLDELQRFTERGGRLRVITTTYMGATEAKAIEELSKLANTEIKISYDSASTRLHAKAYLFYRDTGFTTAYVGSSNLSKAATTSGLEWNVKITNQDQAETIKKMSATFASYWNESEFETYSAINKEKFAAALNLEKRQDSDWSWKMDFFDLRPHHFQEEILDKLASERQVHGRYKNLIVAATGTGKTMIAAFDYKQFLANHPGKKRFLYVAHRQEILVQSLRAFRQVLKDANFGELQVGPHQAATAEQLFVSIQSLNSMNLTEVKARDYYDYIVVDEFHHAAARSYQDLLAHFTPTILLGLTATPERMDGKDILDYFDQHTAAEIRLAQAIRRQLLCPFQYYGVSDNVDLDGLRWQRGAYEISELDNVYVLDTQRARQRVTLIAKALDRYIANLTEVKGLGFCVSVKHANFMAESFEALGISSISLTAESSQEERESAQSKLKNKEIHFIFTVDLYNEGVDIPDVNTVLFLRPTQSLTIFLQQLGRGLRKTEDKEYLTVLDFIGAQNRKYRMAEKFSAILDSNAASLKKEIEHEFPHVPAGCFVQLEKKAQEAVLDNIENYYKGKTGLIQRIREYVEEEKGALTLANFLTNAQMTASEFYRNGKWTFARLCVAAGQKEEFSEPLEELVQRAMPRLIKINSRRWLVFLIRLLEGNDVPQSKEDFRMLRMFQYTLWNKDYADCAYQEPYDLIRDLERSPLLQAELLENLKLQLENIDFVDVRLDANSEIPLDIYCSYSTKQILAALDYGNISGFREGVVHLRDQHLDLLFNTLNKSGKDYSPTTLYNDYSIDERHFHWQSQSTTSADSSTGQRYIHHRARGASVWLFVRDRKNDEFGNADSYTFLGNCRYVSHTGSRPMNIIWELELKIPARFIDKTNKMLVG